MTTSLRRKLHETFKRLFSFLLVRVKAGPLKGKRWIFSSGSRFHEGRYEPKVARVFQLVVTKGAVAYDVGAHVGYFSVLLCDLVGAEGKVISFEPRGINLHYLKRHLEVNDCGQARVIEAAVGDHQGTARFRADSGSGTGHLSDIGEVEVELVSLDALVAEGTIPAPDFLKIDVEGGEVAALEGARGIFQNVRPILVLATHSPELDERCMAFLHNNRYETVGINDGTSGRDILAMPAEKRETLDTVKALP